MLRYVTAAVLALVLVGFACREPYGPASTPDAGAQDVDAAAPAEARDDLAPAIGTPEALDIATWNIENFPQRSSTPVLAAGVILSLDLDLIGVQEIADVDAFAELMTYLPGYDSILSTDTYSDGSYQKVGFIFRTALLDPGPVDLLYTDDWYEFPRPPLEARFTVKDPQSGAPALDFTAIVVHLKAGTDQADRDRRRAAMSLLDSYIQTQIAGAGDDQVVLLGDFNESFETSAALGVWAPVTDRPDIYDLHTEELPADAFSFVPWERLLDHVITTDPLIVGASARTEIAPLEMHINGYTTSVSDHRPVITSITGLW